MSLRRLVSAAAAAALLYAGLTNAHAHVHLCLDGSEPPATLHWTTGDALTPAHDDHSFPHHHHHGAQGAADTHASSHDDASDHGDASSHDDASGHDDIDLEVSASAIAKTVKHDTLAAAPPGLLLALTPPRAAHVPAAADRTPCAPPARTRPQPRAPPVA